MDLNKNIFERFLAVRVALKNIFLNGCLVFVTLFLPREQFYHTGVCNKRFSEIFEKFRDQYMAMSILYPSTRFIRN